ncbi:hypothetical protein HYT45_03990 [Candidatus Uhrbacteria bacterium]|nr:hypothetical protein [Candidatus Uhrbacteria bacterium]
MQLPLSIFLIPYGIYLLIFGVFSLVDIAHLVKYRSSDFTSFAVTFGYLAGSVLLLYATWYFLAGINWNEPFMLFNPLAAQPGLGF